MTEARNTMHLDLSDVHRNSEWDLHSPIALTILSEEASYSQQIIMQFSFSRQPHYYMILLGFPSALLLFLNCVAFLIPVDSGEKLSFVVTLFLAQTLNFATLTNMLPASAENFPIFGIFMVNAIAVMCSTCFSSVIGKIFSCLSTIVRRHIF